MSILERLRDMARHLEGMSTGTWILESGLMSDGNWITTWWRKEHGDDGPICHVSSKRTLYENRRGRGERVSREHTIKNARADAEGIVAIVNGLREIIDEMNKDGVLDETAWLIEWPASRHRPVVYYSAGEDPIMDLNEATRFARKVDAERMARHVGGKAVEYKWLMAGPKENDHVDLRT